MSHKKAVPFFGPSPVERRAIDDLNKMLARRKACGVAAAVSVYGVLCLSTMRIVGIEENVYKARDLAASLGCPASVILLRSVQIVATVGNETTK